MCSSVFYYLTQLFLLNVLVMESYRPLPFDRPPLCAENGTVQHVDAALVSHYSLIYPCNEYLLARALESSVLQRPHRAVTRLLVSGTMTVSQK